MAKLLLFLLAILLVVVATYTEVQARVVVNTTNDNHGVLPQKYKGGRGLGKVAEIVFEVIPEIVNTTNDNHGVLLQKSKGGRGLGKAVEIAIDLIPAITPFIPCWWCNNP